MRIMHSDKCKSGISPIGDLQRGSHFCQFYQTKKDLLDLFVPYFKTGLKNNELCVWVTSRSLGAEDAKKALRRALPGFEKYVKTGQLQFIPSSHCHSKNEKPGNIIASLLDKAVAGGFEGLRLGCSCSPAKNGKVFTCGPDAITNNNAVAFFAYPRDRFDAIGVMEVVKNHRFALIKNAGKWEVLESSEARTLKDALKRSEEKLRSLFSNMSEGFAYHRIVLDIKGRPCDYIFLEVNESFERLTGIKGKDIIGKKVTDALPGIEEDPTDWIGKYGMVALTGKPVQFESYSETLGKWFSVSAFSPRKGYFAVTFSDITERKRYEEDIIRSRQQWERTFDSVPDLIAILDNRHRIVRVNRAMAEQLGMSVDECVGLHCYEYVHGMSEPPEFCPHSRTLRDGCQHFFELYEGRLGGDMLVSTTPITNERGEVTGSVHVARNISELKRAEQKFRILSETAGVLLAAEKPQEIVEKLCTNVMSYLDCQVFFNFIAGSNAGRLRLNAYAGIPAETAKEIEWLDYGVAVCGCAARDGERIISENIPETPDPRTDLVKSYGIKAYACHPLLAGGRVIGTLSFGTKTRAKFTDDEIALMKTVADQVSVAMERKAMEEERERLLEDLKKSNKELEQFAYIASHDLQEPLRMVSSYVQLISRRYKDRLDKDADEFIGYVVNGTSHMQTLLDDLLAYSRVGASGKPFALTDLNSVLDMTTVNLKKLIDDSHAEIKHGSLPAVYADSVQMVQVFQNLIGNAIKFRSNAPPHVKITVNLEDNEWVFCFSDNGIGIDPKYFDRIFNIFKRIHSRDKFDGTGIGLAICKKIVERHGGRLWVESEPGKGSTFYFTLPASVE
jgi:PAS domain S-box-containing protein